MKFGSRIEDAYVHFAKASSNFHMQSCPAPLLPAMELMKLRVKDYRRMILKGP